MASIVDPARPRAIHPFHAAMLAGSAPMFLGALLAGGYWNDTVGEDFELTIRIHRHLRERGEPYRIGFVSDPVCWTEVPAGAGSADSGRVYAGTAA